MFETENYRHVVGRLSGFNLRSEARKAEQWRLWPVRAEQGSLPVTDWHFCVNRRVAGHAGGCHALINSVGRCYEGAFTPAALHTLQSV